MRNVYKSRVTKHLYMVVGEDVYVLHLKDYGWVLADYITVKQLQHNSNYILVKEIT